MTEDENDPVFLTYRATHALAVGNVDAAKADLEKTIEIDPGFFEALALQSIVALVQNDKEQALALADRAVQAGPDESSAHVARSYAQQAMFDLEGARQTLMDAVAADPGDALAYARLAEVQLSFGDLGQAETTAKKAATLAPDLSRTQTVLGFSYLTQVKIEDAMAAFDMAIQLDQADPLPRLGMGLALIRKGNLEEGRAEIEVAASLDPNSSLIRSYLGKAFFEEKRIGLDEREYEIAKELDPNDPTPWFYSAIAKQTTNRPVEALEEIQTAIELNDNRSVYRSKLLLDSDLAARSSSQARIYSDLGFQQRALVEGFNAVNTDPTNHSAHRFLADSYSILPRHEIARVSELLQSQLLQPNNITPIQPRLAESNLFLLSSSGAAENAFNEFNPLFNRNQGGLQASGLIGENETWGGEGVVSGIYNKFSASAGYSHFEADGWRTNSDQDDDLANVFAQYEITHKTSIQAEYRYRELERGDTSLRFFQEDFDPELRQKEEYSTIRAGVKHAFSAGSILLGNFAYSDGDRNEQTKDEPILKSFDLTGDDEAYSGELQYLLRSKTVKLAGGVGYFDVDQKDKLTSVIELFPGTTVTDEIENDLGLQHSNLYLYSYWDFFDNLTLTLGASGDFLNSDTEQIKERDQFNPKVGISWAPLSGTTFRAAAFRVLKRTLITDQTLEPTQVAGFNQFFDDDNGTDAWRYGAAIDQKITKTIYGGLEYSSRDLEVPFQDVDLNTGESSLKEADWEENLFRAYFFWAPHNWFSLSAEYLYEEFERDEAAAFGVKNLDTHYLPLGLNFFHPSGISASIKGTFVNQKGEFERDFMEFESGEDDFWLMDASIGYRFPKRYGFLTVGASNLFDESFEYFDTDPENPRIQPARTVFAKITLAIP